MPLDFNKMGPVDLANAAFNQSVSEVLLNVKQDIFFTLKNNPSLVECEHVFYSGDSQVVEKVIRLMVDEGFTAVKKESQQYPTYVFGGWVLANKSPYR